jgi:outer membrane protein TolC
MITNAYFDLYIARRATEIHLEHADVLRQLTDLAQAKYASGGGAQQDVLKSIVEESMLHDDLLMLDLDQRLASARVNALLNRPMDTPIGPLDNPREQTLLAPLDELQAIAAKDRPEVIAARQEVERARAELAVAQLDYKPDYSVQGGYMVMPHQSDAVLLQGSISWPAAPWSRKKVDLHVEESHARVAAAQARVDALENEARLAVEAAYLRAKTAEQRQALFRTTVLPQSRQTLDLSRISYQTGQGDVLAMLDNERMLLNGELAYYKALTEFQQAIAELERATGAELPAGSVVDVPTEAVGR